MFQVSILKQMLKSGSMKVHLHVLKDAKNVVQKARKRLNIYPELDILKNKQSVRVIILIE